MAHLAVAASVALLTSGAASLATDRAVAAQDGSPAASPQGLPDNPYFETGAVPGSGAGRTIGYISRGEEIESVRLSTDSIREQAGIAGARLLVCDSGSDEAEALDCGRSLGAQQVQAILSSQAFADSAATICDATHHVPTVAIDSVQGPCEVTFMGANEHEAGRIAGAAVGRYARDRWGCDYTAWVSLEPSAPAAPDGGRMGGYRDGFGESCPLDPAKDIAVEGVEGADVALARVSQLLPSLDGDRIIVVAATEDAVLGAMEAARAAGREGDLVFSGQGTDPSIWGSIACDARYIASTAYFPERYGKTVIPAIIDILDGRPVARQLFTEHQVVDASNIRDLYPDTPACAE